MKYTQDQNFNIKGPGLLESGAVSVGVRELQAAYDAGMLAASCVYRCRGTKCAGCEAAAHLDGRNL